MIAKATTLVLLLSGIALGLELEKDEGVFVLTEKNYEDAVKEYKYLLVEFYAPWCGHCKALAPEYVKAAQLLKEKDSEIRLAKVDGTENEELIKQHQIKGYPTLFLYRDGEPVKYSGGRMAQEIVGWLEKKTGPESVILDDIEKARDFVDDNEVAVIGFFKDQNSAKAKAYKAAVKDYEEYPCAITSDEKAFEKYEAKDEQVILLKKFDEGRAVYEGDISNDALQAFIRKYGLPLVVDWNHETAQRVFKNLVDSHLLVFVNKSADGYDETAKSIQTLAEEYRHKIMFIVLDLAEDDNRRPVEFLGLKADEMPTLRIIQMKDNDVVKYKPEKAGIDADNVRTFVDDYLAGKVPVNLKTQELPEDWDANPVKVLTGVNFDKVVFDKTKNVLVEFYAPWCGHCKTLAPVWDKVAEFLAKKEDIVVAKMDATENELEHTKVRSFPTIQLFKKGDNEMVEYNGERTLEGITKFLSSGGEYGRAAPDHDEL